MRRRLRRGLRRRLRLGAAGTGEAQVVVGQVGHDDTPTTDPGSWPAFGRATAGDTGSEACYQADTSVTSLSVQDPASQPFVTGVGGTRLMSEGPPPSEIVWNDAYDRNGVPHYWQVDLVRRQILQYPLIGDPHVGGHYDEPVTLREGDNLGSPLFPTITMPVSRVFRYVGGEGS